MAATSSTRALLARATLVSQGAEAKVYKAELHPPLVIDSATSDSDSLPQPTLSRSFSETVFLKHRFAKGYRHPTLDASLTRARIAGETRALQKCLRAGVNVPALRMVDAPEGVLGIEWIEGRSLRALLGGGEEDEFEAEAVDEEEDGSDVLHEYGVSVDQIMDMIGVEIAKMHLADVVHGDLTTSNMMLRRRVALLSRQSPSQPKNPSELLLVDFGLAYTSTLTEDKAVDLYVLERAFASTHPASEPMFTRVLAAYAARVGKKEWEKTGRRLEDVRLRGRKRSMVG